MLRSSGRCGQGRLFVVNSGMSRVQVYDAEDPGSLDEVTGTNYLGSNEGAGAWMRGWGPPHMLDDTTCSRCHDVDDQPDGHLGLADGQANLCFSCHSGGGQAAAALVPFCLNCHDEDGDTPFSDGRVPPPVDPDLWVESSHNLGGEAAMPLTCMGDGANFGCHGNGHGSPNIKLLSADEGLSLDDFCYNCHTEGVVPNDALANNRPGGYVSADDIGADTLAAASNAIFNSMGNPVGTSPVAMIGNDCPAWGTTFPIENEPQSSATTDDSSGLLIGTVGNPDYVFPDADNDWFNGIEDEAVEDTHVDYSSNQACLNSPRAITIEARVKPTEVDRGVGDNTFNRIFERRRTILITILNTNYRGDDVPSRAGQASIEVKYRVDPTSRHTCPHPQWPGDPYVGNDVRMHQISSSIEDFPIVNDHWYQIKVVFNADKSDVPGSNGTPVDIFIDDLGTNGDDADENWPGYRNASVAINDSSSCRWGALPGDFLQFRSDTGHIGASWSHAQEFEGLIDWVTWQPIADYSGVDDPPN